MKGLISIAGFVAGLVVAALVVMFHPFYPKAEIRNFTGPDVMVNGYSVSEYGGMMLTARAYLGLGDFIGRDHGFLADGIRNTTAAVAILRDDDGQPAALATKLSATAANSNLLLGKVGAVSYWNVFWPNAGSIFLVGEENHWPIVQAAVTMTMRGDSLQAGSSDYVVTVRPEERRVSGVLGSSGIYTGATGMFQETIVYDFAEPDNVRGEIAMQVNIE